MLLSFAVLLVLPGSSHGKLILLFPLSVNREQNYISISDQRRNIGWKNKLKKWPGMINPAAKP